jgi:FixJ family two-component response regulator
MADAKPLAYVVDDEEIICKTLALILNQQGYEAIAFTQPLEALRDAKDRCPDVLVTAPTM